MNKLIQTIIFITLCNFAFAQNQKWEVYLGESNRDDDIHDIVEEYDLGYYMAGAIYSGGTNNGGWCIKTDINGTILYDKILEHDIYNIVIKGITTDSNGNKYICGPKFINTTWPYVIKLDSCGGLVWCKLLDDELFEDGTALDILINKNDEIVILCRFHSESEFDRIHLIGLNEYGDVLWINPYASRNNYSWIRQATGYDLIESNNEYYISGYCYWPYPNDTNHVFLRPLFIGIDSLFNEKWILPFYALDSIYGFAFSTIAINDSVIMGTGYRLSGEYNKNSLLMFFNTDGEEISYKQIPNEDIGSNIDFNAIRDIERINDSLFISPFYLGIGGETYFGEFVIDTTGTIHKQEIRGIYKGTSSIIKTSDNNYLIEIEVAEGKSDSDILLYKIDKNLESVPFDTNTYVYDSLCPYQIQSGTIDITNCLIWTGIGEVPTPQEYYASLRTIPIKAYPNPVSEGEVTFEFENTEYHKDMELRCFNIIGKLVHEEKVYRYQGKSVVDVSRWNKGLYVAVVLSEGTPVGRAKFVVR